MMIIDDGDELRCNRGFNFHVPGRRNALHGYQYSNETAVDSFQDNSADSIRAPLVYPNGSLVICPQLPNST